MTQLELIKKYPDVNPTILSQYKEAEKTMTFNDGDPDLVSITIDLPSPPELHKIANFGLPARKQKFKPIDLPDKLRQLVAKSETIDRVWEELGNNQFFYRKEIEFIKRQWQYFIYGYWVFINGVPTYMDGWHWFYCNWWKIDSGLPEYRSRDRMFFLFARHCYTTTMAVYQYRVMYKDEWYYFSKKDSALQFCKDMGIGYESAEYGLYWLDKKKRTIIGFTYAKFRREGATYKACCVLYCIAIVSKNGLCGIQSLRDDHAEDVFKIHIVSPWKTLPFIFRPNYEGTTDPKSELSFNPPPIKLSSKGSRTVSPVGLNTRINFQKANGDGYDSRKLLAHEHDEVGKFESPLDINTISQRLKPCFTLDQGQTIVGFGVKTSTVGDTAPGGGGDLFKNYCEMSMYHDRNANGHTMTGFVNLFIPTSNGIVRDEFGNSIVEDPTTPTYDRDGLLIKYGGKTIIRNTRRKYLDEGKLDELALEKRENPEYFAECFSASMSLSRLPIGKIELQLEKIKFRNDTKRQGNFYFIDGFGSNVAFRDDPLGKWYFSMELDKLRQNHRYFDQVMNSWVPGNKSQFTLGVDPFKHNITKGTRRSEGGGAVFWHHNPALDSDPDYSKWNHSCRFVCTYSNRTYDKEEFYIDMLMTAIFFGCGIYPELNISEIWEWFDRNKYGEYMVFKLDYATGKESITPGDTMSMNFKEEMFTDMSTQLNRHCEREVHDELLRQCKTIAGPKETTKYDLFTAAGWALKGSKQYYQEFNTFDNQKDDLKDTFRKRRV